MIVAIHVSTVFEKLIFVDNIMHEKLLVHESFEVGPIVQHSVAVPIPTVELEQ